jgi:hypothetical protein
MSFHAPALRAAAAACVHGPGDDIITAFMEVGFTEQTSRGDGSRLSERTEMELYQWRVGAN